MCGMHGSVAGMPAIAPTSSTTLPTSSGPVAPATGAPTTPSPVVTDAGDGAATLTKPKAKAHPAKGEPAAEPKRLTYKIHTGDTLFDIANTLGLKGWKYLAKINKDSIGSPRDIAVGTTIELPGHVTRAQLKHLRETARERWDNRGAQGGGGNGGGGYATGGYGYGGGSGGGQYQPTGGYDPGQGGGGNGGGGGNAGGARRHPRNNGGGNRGNTGGGSQPTSTPTAKPKPYYLPNRTTSYNGFFPGYLDVMSGKATYKNPAGPSGAVIIGSTDSNSLPGPITGG